ncbi:VOC family protein [Pararhodobacter marinus]|uniref:VOC family protein n=1 Tax=Pararhodobacter marinus TaxID=2184063 RepID=UPI0035134DC1
MSMSSEPANAMLSYLTLGTGDLDRAQDFYDAVLGALGYARLENDANGRGYGLPGASHSGFWINEPYDRRPAGAGNGTMACFNAPSRAAVRAFHAAGLAHGGRDEGAPGLRDYGPHFYAAYLRDPDGNKLSAVCEAPE